MEKIRIRNKHPESLFAMNTQLLSPNSTVRKWSNYFPVAHDSLGPFQIYFAAVISANWQDTVPESEAQQLEQHLQSVAADENVGHPEGVHVLDVAGVGQRVRVNNCSWIERT